MMDTQKLLVDERRAQRKQREEQDRELKWKRTERQSRNVWPQKKVCVGSREEQGWYGWVEQREGNGLDQSQDKESDLK